MKNTALATAIGVSMMLPAFAGHPAFARSSAWGDIVGEHDAPSVAAPVGAPKTPAHAVSLDDALRGLAAQWPVSVTVLQGGHVVRHLEFADDQPQLAEAMSVTKAVSALLAGMVIGDGALGHLDEPLSTRTPSFAQAPFANTTLRQIMHQTSCLRTGLPSHQEALLAHGTSDLFAATRRVTRTCEPGSEFFYGNIVPNVVSEAIEHNTGASMATYAARRLFAPLGIEQWAWPSDQRGHTPVHAGLQLTSFELAKIGQLVAQRGRFGDEQVLPAEFVDELYQASAPNPRYSLFWTRAREAGAADASNSDRLAAIGFAGQALYASPRKGVVVSVLTRPDWAWRLFLGARSIDQAFPRYEAIERRMQQWHDRIWELACDDAGTLDAARPGR